MSRTVVGLQQAWTAKRSPPLMILATLTGDVNQFGKLGARVAVVATHRRRTPKRSAWSNALASQGKLNPMLSVERSAHVRHDLEKSGPFIGVGGMAVSLFLYGYTAIGLASWLHSLVMPLVWLALFVASCRWFTTHPRAVVLLPVLSIAVWFGVILTFG